MNIDIKFRNPEQEIYFWNKFRNSRMGGGFGNGKTYVACQRAVVRLATFSNYRYAIARQVYKNLRATTMQTFFKICPQELIYRHDEQFGLTVLTNRSVVYWLHLDAMDEATAKGFEINSLLIDQAEEVEESIYLLMDARVGRWDKAQVPDYLLKQYPEWPRHPDWGHPLVPNCTEVLDNPADDEFHWVERYYSEESLERKANHFSIVRATDDRLNDSHTIEQIKTRSQEWLDKYYFGKPGMSKARIHRIPQECIIDTEELTDEQLQSLLTLIRTKAGLFRILDHGETSPTCCGWFAAFNNIHIVFAEYYLPNELISNHRQNIYDISIEVVGRENLDYFTDFADPSIFKEDPLKKGGHWSVAKEYSDTDEITSPPFTWLPADNNEFATRNRINELLRPNAKWMHPVTKVSPAPGLYFLKRSDKYPQGVHNIIIETNKQKRVLLGELNGEKFYSDERDDTIVDHAYDVLRYYVAQHNRGITEPNKPPPKRSFASFNRILKRRPSFYQGSV